MANFLQGLLGAGAGLLTGGIGSAVLGGIGGLTSSGPQESPVMKQARLQQQQAANQMFNFAGSVPGSAPDELSNLAQSRAMLGEQQRQQQNRVMGSWNPNQGTSATGLLQNMGNTAIAQQMAQRSSFLMDAAANRRRALMDAANLGQGAASLYRPQQPQFPQVAAQLAQMLAYQQAQKRAQAHQQPGTGAPVNMNAGWNPASTPGFTPQYSGNSPQPGAIDWQQLGASGQLGAPAGEDMSIYGEPMDMAPGLLAAIKASGWNGIGPLPSDIGEQAATRSFYQGFGPQGSGALGNEHGGMNSVQNQARQSMGLGRTIDLGGGLRLRF